MTYEVGEHEGMYEDLSVSYKIAFGRAVARMLDTQEIPNSSLIRGEIRRRLDRVYMQHVNAQKGRNQHERIQD